ncbi:DNA polymerase III subunit alpha [Aneurinibacillus terranovensis]|uniref:DNA polymerase III subunit alpha n=1 Tax=Aneurinibacillus terranovensis TaxID=278991 RepID=UPI00041E392C|nr:DNA polymerase III subunit alpha [Aneurinibacillus terranovensis]
MATFAHLRVHSEYSLLDSAVRIELLIKKAKELGMTALALTDRAVMYGAIPFYKACLDEGIRPILGMEVYVTNVSLSDRLPAHEEPVYQLVLLAENLEGYRNLLRLTSIAHLEGLHYKPRVTKEILRRYSDGLIALSGAGDGEIGYLLLHDRIEEAKQAARFYQEVYGKDCFFLELQEHNLAEQKQLNTRTVALGREMDLPLVATNSVRYIDREDYTIYQVLQCIGQGKTLDEARTLKIETDEYYLKSAAEMSDRFVFLPEAIENTERIGNRCDVQIPLGRHILPQFPIHEGTTADAYLKKLCYEGLLERYGGDVPESTRERLDYELSVIKQMGFSDYFLIVWDFIRYARENGIAVGPGRGSAAGSLVAYTLRITNIDPVKYKLLFERFLNPERVSMPDIDVDFSYDRRDEVIRYVVEKYGPDRVAQIITFGTMAARAAIRDVGRVLNMAPGTVDRIAKLIPAEPGMTLDKALQRNAQLKQAMEENSQTHRLFMLAQAVEGMPRHASTHAAGVVISREPLTEYVPLQEGHEGHALTQYAMEQLEEIGLLKMDFLGLRNLTLLENAVSFIREHEGQAPDLARIPLDDEASYRLLAEADTAGVFQLESGGMRRVLREVRPSVFEDIVAVLALFRPGPMEFIPDFAAAKHGKHEVTYLHPALKPILQDTYGFILYQEQIMQIASSVAGFTLGEADILRRAVSKKKKELLQEQRERFVAGCLAQGHDSGLANQLYDWIVRFADYGFNRSHSAAYALIAYQTAYLKANYPLPFMAALLTMVMGNTAKVAEYIEECKRKSILVLPPDINHSDMVFTIDNGALRVGLAAVKNVGVQAIRHLIDERKQGAFVDLHDVCLRTDPRICNRRVLEALILCGAMDSLPGHRAALLEALEEVIEWSSRLRKEREASQMVLFRADANKIERPELPLATKAFSPKEMLEQEKEFLGLYLSGHPLEEFDKLFDHPSLTPVHRLGEKENESVSIAGMVVQCKRITTKKGDSMAFLTLEDKHAQVEVVIFPRVYEKYAHLLKKDRVLVMEGKIDKQGHTEGGIKFIANHITDAKESECARPPAAALSQVVYIKVEKNVEEDTDRLTRLKNVLVKNKGTSPVVLYYAAKKQPVQLSKEYAIHPTEELIKNIEKIVGAGRIIVKNKVEKLL